LKCKKQKLKCKKNKVTKEAVLLQPLFFISLKKISMFKILAKINKLLLPSFTKQQLDLAKAKKWQMAIIGWKYYVTTRALD
jgi:hypothetical protein